MIRYNLINILPPPTWSFDLTKSMPLVRGPAHHWLTVVQIYMEINKDAIYGSTSSVKECPNHCRVVKCIQQCSWLHCFGTSPIQNEDPKIVIPKRKYILYTSILSSNWHEQKFLYFHYKSVKLDVLCRQNKIWTFGNPFQSKKLPICT